MDTSVSKLLEVEEAELLRQHAELAAAIKRIDYRREYLAELRAKAGGQGKGAAPAKPSSNGDATATDGLQSPTDAILAFLRKHPGSTRTDVMDNVVGHIRTASKHPRGLVRTMIGQMLKQGKLEEDDENLKVAKTPDEK